MGLSDLTNRDAVLSAIREYDTVGQDAFLAKYGYSRARRYQLVHDGKSYDPKAIAGVAFGYQFPQRGPLQPSEFSSGEATVVPLLQKLNFDVQTIGKDGSDRGDDANNIASQHAVQTGLEHFLAAYPSTRSTITFGQHGELKNELNLLRSALEALPAVQSRPHIHVSWSVGQGSSLLSRGLH